MVPGNRDEVLAINDKVVLRASDLLSWLCAGASWEWGLRAVWRGACAPPRSRAARSRCTAHGSTLATWSGKESAINPAPVSVPNPLIESDSFIDSGSFERLLIYLWPIRPGSRPTKRNKIRSDPAESESGASECDGDHEPLDPAGLDEDVDSPGVVVFSYPRYCRYRALLSRLEGIQGDWLRDSLVAALGGYAAPTKNTRILYCKRGVTGCGQPGRSAGGVRRAHQEHEDTVLQGAWGWLCDRGGGGLAAGQPGRSAGGVRRAHQEHEDTVLQGAWGWLCDRGGGDWLRDSLVAALGGYAAPTKNTRILYCKRGDWLRDSLVAALGGGGTPRHQEHEDTVLQEGGDWLRDSLVAALGGYAAPTKNTRILYCKVRGAAVIEGGDWLRDSLVAALGVRRAHQEHEDTVLQGAWGWLCDRGGDWLRDSLVGAGGGVRRAHQEHEDTVLQGAWGWLCDRGGGLAAGQPGCSAGGGVRRAHQEHEDTVLQGAWGWLCDRGGGLAAGRLVAALGGYAAPTKNTRILYCKDTFEYPELEGHEFVCNQLAPKLKGRPRGRAGAAPASTRPRPPRAPRQRGGRRPPPPPEQTPRRLSLRNGAPKYSDDEEKEQTPEDRAFLQQLRQFYRDRKEPFKLAHSLKDRE
ncbi:hypothetical protein MSG28_014799 [Choristoneura fumiferana]|uniref:Uncharacterized protein n=1 Tax=Choristoneura fumiferana TaxID=7141 RepID=A0ACC0JSP1_CHOFU|nr:hypothetical protein MSG28_014799 [Choristoneura fumiferana]